MSVKSSSVISDVNQVAMDWARDHAAERIGTKWYDGEKGTGPSEKWAISESTRNRLRGVITEAFSRETSIKELAQRIREAGGFSEERAKLIADTEANMAMSHGNVAAWKKTGVVKSIKWLKSSLHNVPDECDLNADGGAVLLGQAFPSGDEAPPAHPGCRCVVAIAELNEPKKRSDY
ncbi:MAG: phage minor head protein [Terracidiphilus sp.]|jgi:SPP1 gp7 family putative phage head morphogenesis protein